MRNTNPVFNYYNSNMYVAIRIELEIPDLSVTFSPPRNATCKICEKEFIFQIFLLKNTNRI